MDVHLNGAPSGLGFLIMPGGAEVVPGTLSIGPVEGREVEVSLRTSPKNGATIRFEYETIRVGEAGTDVRVHAASPSLGSNDTTIEVVEGSTVLARYDLTAIQRPRIRFSGRFQCRLATDPDPHDHPWGIASSFGMYAVQGPDPDNPDEPPLDRIVRFEAPVALRPFCEPVGVRVSGIEGDVEGTSILFEAGDALIGAPVRFGPGCKFDARDGEFAFPGFEPISDFTISIGDAFTGKSAPGEPRMGSEPPPTTAPYADGFFRLDQIGPWRPADFGYPEETWAEHADARTAEKIIKLQNQVPRSAAESRIRTRRIQEHTDNLGGLQFTLRMVERYIGLIDREIAIYPGASAVLGYFTSLPAFAFRGEFFDFDTDCQCGTTAGTIGPAGG